VNLFTLWFKRRVSPFTLGAYILRETHSERCHSIDTNVNVECESEPVHSVVWYRVKGYTAFMDNMECESEPVHLCGLLQCHGLA
jgi:hypothetical protein